MPRITDIYALPSITGKFELEYEGELKGADNVAREMIRSAVAIVFDGWFPNADLRQVTEWFDLGGNLQVDDALPAAELVGRTAGVQGLHEAARTAGLAKRPGEPHLASAIDFVLEGMYAQRKISRSVEGQFQAAEQPKRPVRTMDPLTERDLPTGRQEEVLQLADTTIHEVPPAMTSTRSISKTSVEAVRHAARERLRGSARALR